MHQKLLYFYFQFVRTCYTNMGYFINVSFLVMITLVLSIKGESNPLSDDFIANINLIATTWKVSDTY